MANQPIPVEQAKGMMREYVSFMQAKSAASQTQYVSFDFQKLLNWLSGASPYADEIRICEGIYPAGHASAGKISVIIWPYKNGKPAKKPRTEGKGGDDDDDIEPFNDGNSGP